MTVWCGWADGCLCSAVSGHLSSVWLPCCWLSERLMFATLKLCRDWWRKRASLSHYSQSTAHHFHTAEAANKSWFIAGCMSGGAVAPPSLSPHSKMVLGAPFSLSALEVVFDLRAWSVICIINFQRPYIDTACLSRSCPNDLNRPQSRWKICWQMISLNF